MTCGACSKAVEKIFSKCEDITSVECDVEGQKVTVVGKDGLDLVEMLAKWVSRYCLMCPNSPLCRLPRLRSLSNSSRRIQLQRNESPDGSTPLT